MAKQQQQPSKSSGGPDPEMWESDAASYVAQSNSATLASMTGGDAGMFEGIVDHILMGEEDSAPSEQEIMAAEDVGMIERNYPAEVESECNASPSPPRQQMPGSGLTSSPTHTAPDAVSFGAGGGDVMSASLEGVGELGASEGALDSVMAPQLAQMGSYGASGGGGDTGGQIVDHKKDDAKLFSLMTGEGPDTQQCANANVLGQIDGTVAGLTAQIDGFMGGLSGSLSGIFSGGQASIDSTFGSMWGLVDEAFTTAQTDIDASAADTLARIETATTAGFDHIDSASEAALMAASQHIASESNRISRAGADAGTAGEARIDQGKQTVQQHTDAAVALARQLGTDEAARWRGMGLGGTDGKRAEARAQVAEQVSSAYAEDLPQHGRDAQEAMEADKSNMLASIDQLIAPIILEQFPALLERAQQSVEEKATTVKDNLTAAAEQASTTVQENHAETSEALAENKAAAQGQLITTHSTASQDLDAVHETGQGALATIADHSNVHLAQKADQYNRLIANNPMMPLDQLTPEVAEIEAGLEENAAGAEVALQASHDSVAESMLDVSNQAVMGMSAFGSASAQSARDTAAQTVAGFDELGTGFEDSVDQQLADYDAALAQLQLDLEERTAQLYADVTSALDQGLTSLDEGITEFTDGFQTNLDNAVRGTADDQMMGTIQRIGDEEAAKIKEPSFWDKVMSVVKVLIVIAIVIAIAVLVPMALAAIPAFAALSAGGAIVGTIVAGAIAGCITSLATEIVLQIAQNGWNPANWDGWKILRETLVGGLVGGLTAGVGAVLKNSASAARAAQAAAGADEVASLTRMQSISLRLVNQQGELSALGDFVMGFSGGIVGDVVKSASQGQMPDLLQTFEGAGLKGLSGAYGNGFANALGLTGDAYGAAQAGFSTYMEEMVKETRSGDIQGFLEQLNLSADQIGELDLSEEYQPTWQPTW
jgi:hypothetical protein